MRRLLIFISILVGVSGISAQDTCVAPSKGQVDERSTPVPLCLVTKKITETLNEYNSDPTTASDRLPNLQKADFEFKTVTSNTVGFKFGILVFNVGATRKSETTNAVNFGYVVPPPPPKVKGMTEQAYLDYLDRRPKPKDFSTELVKTMREAAEQIKLAGSVEKTKFKTLTITPAYGSRGISVVRQRFQFSW
jgi:hypothetical protein